jgi:hypothetical protein
MNCRLPPVVVSGRGWAALAGGAVTTGALSLHPAALNSSRLELLGRHEIADQALEGAAA